MQIPVTDTFGYAEYYVNEKKKNRFASFVGLFLEVQVRIEPCP